MVFLLVNNKTTQRQVLSYEIGLKLWSTNIQYTNQIINLYDSGTFDYIELFTVPKTYKDTISVWQKFSIPFVIHAPHTSFGMNFSLIKLREQNKPLIQEALDFADILSADSIIFHPGVNGSLKETIRQISLINDNRICIENKPYWGINNELCIGSSPEEISMIMVQAKTSFCLDIGHAICAANAKKQNPIIAIRQFLALNPVLFHLSDGNYAGIYDQHEHFSTGNFPLPDIIRMLPGNARITIETKKESSEHLNDFIQDSRYLKNLYQKLATR